MAKGDREGSGRSSLGEYAASLSAGSNCFCCGKPLTLAKSEPHPEFGGRGSHRLTCTYCGSEVEHMERAAFGAGTAQLALTNPEADAPEEPAEKDAASDTARNAA